jgi:hypothetical protein
MRTTQFFTTPQFLGELPMKLKVTYNNGTSELFIISTDCSTEMLIAQIERHEYNPKVAKVEVVGMPDPDAGMPFDDFWNDEQ